MGDIIIKSFNDVITNPYDPSDSNGIKDLVSVMICVPKKDGNYIKFDYCEKTESFKNFCDEMVKKTSHLNENISSENPQDIIMSGNAHHVFTSFINYFIYNELQSLKNNHNETPVKSPYKAVIGAGGYDDDQKKWLIAYTRKPTAPLSEKDFADALKKEHSITLSLEEKIKIPSPNDINRNNVINVIETVGREIDISINTGKKMIVFTGAPGTGKTYSVEEYVNKMVKDNTDRKKFVQFHSSFDYSDFVEGLRPVRNKNGDMEFVRMDGIFKAFCREAVENEPAYKAYFNARGSFEKAKKNCRLMGDENGYQLTEAENKLKAAKDSLKDAEKRFSADSTLYYFIIDEINRADLGRVFGELMYCFEKRGFEHAVETQYSNLKTYNRKGRVISDDVFEDGFFVPANVVVIGTMNDIDRSVETFDFALRRRFDWYEIEADKVMETSLTNMITGDIADLLVKIKELNAEIAKEEYGLGNAFMIGPAYFKNYDGNNGNKDEERQKIWNRNIEPILREYMRGRKKAVTFIENCAAKFGVTSSYGRKAE